MKKYQSPEEIDMSDLLNNVIEQTPPESVRFIKQSLAMANYIESLLSVKGLRQKDLADKMGKSEAEISKWLSGTHNFTLRSIAKIESVLNENLIEIPNKKALSGNVRKRPINPSNKIAYKIIKTKSTNSIPVNETVF